jgi:hypothetical protein
LLAGEVVASHPDWAPSVGRHNHKQAYLSNRQCADLLVECILKLLTALARFGMLLQLLAFPYSVRLLFDRML